MSRREAETERTVALLERTARDLLRYLERRVGADDAPDALSETMTTAWRRESSMPASDAEARLWVFGIARNVVLNTNRGRRRRNLLAERLRQTADPLEVVAPPSDGDLDVRAAIGTLDAELSELVRLVHWDGFTISEAARILDVPASTARSRYQKAKRDLSALLAPTHAG
ncbi:RNA polymerase sigma factor [Herbiconiux sp.]|uniref:RNA polymerase sigma factor n=1 Tax=Herbiconiux sp. TaxID=1871186 RepID=UPI0025C6487D|nr:RNA polymerase sigma factor [Herbiconiux sp.]